MLKYLKGAIKSKTFWFNVVTGVLFITDKMLGADMIPPEVASTISAVGNVILRFVTNKALKDK